LAGLDYSKPVSTGSQGAIALGPVHSELTARLLLPTNLLVAAGLVILYFLAGKFGLLFASIQPNTSAFWPSAGIALAAMLLFGYRLWPAVFVAAFLVNATTAGSVASSFGIAAGNTLEALAGAYLVNRFANGCAAFDRALDAFKFIALAAVASTMVSATIGVASLTLTGYAKSSHFGRIWFTWWLGDAAGDLVFAPLMLLCGLNPRLNWDRKQSLEFGLLFGLLAFVSWLVFGGVLPPDIQREPIDFLCIPFLIWVAFRFSPRETAVANFVLSAIAVAGTHRALGPFAISDPGSPLLLLQGFLSVMCLSLVIAAGVAQRRRADEERAGLAAIVDSSGDAIIGQSPDRRITSWNAGAERLFGYSAEQAVGQPISILVPEDRLDEEAKVFERVYRGQVVSLAETVRMHKDGRRVDVSLAVSPIKDRSGRIIGASSIARDISQHKRVTRALRESEEQFRLMADTVPDILFTGNPDGMIDYTNQRFCEYTGMPKEAAVGMGWVSALHREDVERAGQGWLRLVGKGEPFEQEFRMRAADGNYRWFIARARPIRNGEGAIVKWFGSCTEIEEQKRAQREREKLLRAEQIARAEAEAAASKLQQLQAVTDSPLPEQTLDEMLQDLLARLKAAFQSDTASVLLLKPGERELSPAAWVGFEEEVDPDLKVPLGRGIEGRIATSDRGLIFNDTAAAEAVNPLLRRHLKSLVGAPLKIENTLIGVIHVGSFTPREFTEEHLDLIRLVANRAAVAIERTRLHENERLARAAAEEASRAKDEFLAMLGHELRNPLGAIVASMETLERCSTDPQRTGRARQIMSRQLKHLRRLVDDLLDVARVTTGRIDLHRRKMDLAESVQACLDALEDRLSPYDVKVDIESVWVDGDPTRLEQVATNLLRNAVEYTPAGGRIRVSVMTEGRDAVLRVEDSGMGISAELLPRVFDLFVQNEQELDRPVGGLGIGLTLTRRLVGLHGGSVEAASPGPGQGSVFTVRLPRIAAPPPKAEPAAIAIKRRTRRRVLIVEDNADAREALRSLLELSGHEIYEAADGPHGVEQALALKPDMALIDIGLPSLDGYEVARQIRSAPGGRSIFLVALTGYGQPRDRQQAHEAGFDVHLVKPVDLERLSTIIGAPFA